MNGQTDSQLFLGHPKGLVTLFFTEMWERMSYYGMRALFTIFLVAETTSINPGFGWTNEDAIWLYGWYTMLVYLAAIPGGWIADNILGQTAYYSPSDMSIVLFITDRHPKDICRSFSHELVHHHQNERGDLDMGDVSSPTYAQDDKHMRRMEMEAYLKGNMLFRDWEDWYKNYRKTNKR